MKKLLSVAIGVFSLIGCNDHEEQALPNERRFTLDNYDQVHIGTNVTFVNIVEPSATANGRTAGSGNPSLVTVSGDPELIASVSIEVIDGIAYIRANQNLALEDSIKVVFNTADIGIIKLEADQHATVDWLAEQTIIENLEIITEANSQLNFFGLKANNVLIKQEAESQVLLTSGGLVGTDSLVLEKQLLEVTSDSSALIDGNVLLTFSTIELYTGADSKEYYIMKGDEIRASFIIDNVTVKTEATSSFDAVEAAVANMDIHLEGKSYAQIWVLDHLTGVGKGESMLYYLGNPQVDFTTEGSAGIGRL